MVLTTNLLMLQKALHYAIERVLTIGSISILRKFLVEVAICHGYEPILMPEGTIACAPHLPTHITKLPSATVDHQKSIAPRTRMDQILCLPTCDMVASMLKFHHSSTVEAPPPILAFGHF